MSPGETETRSSMSKTILTIVFFLGLSLLNALIPIDLNTLLLSFLIVHLLQQDVTDV